MPSRSPATIVVLEENAAARELIERTLREAGNRVLVTNDPYEALELARRVRIGRTECLNVGHFRATGAPYVLDL